MKIAYPNIVKYIPSKPSINEISNKLFQLGHEHEIENEVFNLEFTPNRGDCLSISGLLRDLAIFYDIDFQPKIYKGNINKLDFSFHNKAISSCSSISFLKIDIEEKIFKYSGPLKDYFDSLDNNKNNFFADISNFVSYELGQPTHCYDFAKLKEPITLKHIRTDKKFETLLGKEIVLNNNDLLFCHVNTVIILAGIIC